MALSSTSDDIMKMSLVMIKSITFVNPMTGAPACRLPHEICNMLFLLAV
jgi:hypothetical protein